MKEMWKKYKRQIQIGGGICLIGVLGIGGYVAANQDTAVQTKVEAKQEAKSSNQKIAKTDPKDTTSNKKTGTKQDTGKGQDRTLLSGWQITLQNIKNISCCQLFLQILLLLRT